MCRLRLRRGQGNGMMPNQGRRHKSPGLISRLGIRWILNPRRRQGQRRKLSPQRGWRRRLAAEAGADTRVRVEAKAEVRERDVGILMDVLNKVKAESNGLKRAMVGSKRYQGQIRKYQGRK